MTPINKFIARKQRLYKIGWIIFFPSTAPWLFLGSDKDARMSLILIYVIALIVIRSLTIASWRANYQLVRFTVISGRDEKQLQLYRAWQLRMQQNPPRGFKGVISWIVFGSWKKQAW
jgi:hypothetical protein